MTVESRVFTLPLALTLLRLIVAPLLLPFLCVMLAPYNYVSFNLVLAILFTLFSLTDFFDGYFARRYRQVSLMGKVLDALADKILSYSTLIALLVVHKVHMAWVLIFIGREFLVMGLRELALKQGTAVEVSWWGKWKTVVLSVYLAVALANPYQTLGAGFWVNFIESLLLAASLALSVWSGMLYARDLVRLTRLSPPSDNDLR